MVKPKNDIIKIDLAQAIFSGNYGTSGSPFNMFEEVIRTPRVSGIPATEQAFLDKNPAHKELCRYLASGESAIHRVMEMENLDYRKACKSLKAFYGNLVQNLNVRFGQLLVDETVDPLTALFRTIRGNVSEYSYWNRNFYKFFKDNPQYLGEEYANVQEIPNIIQQMLWKEEKISCRDLHPNDPAIFLTVGFPTLKEIYWNSPSIDPQSPINTLIKIFEPVERLEPRLAKNLLQELTEKYLYQFRNANKTLHTPESIVASTENFCLEGPKVDFDSSRKFVKAVIELLKNKNKNISELAKLLLMQPDIDLQQVVSVVKLTHKTDFIYDLIQATPVDERGTLVEALVPNSTFVANSTEISINKLIELNKDPHRIPCKDISQYLIKIHCDNGAFDDAVNDAETTDKERLLHKLVTTNVSDKKTVLIALRYLHNQAENVPSEDFNKISELIISRNPSSASGLIELYFNNLSQGVNVSEQHLQEGRSKIIIDLIDLSISPEDLNGLKTTVLNLTKTEIELYEHTDSKLRINKLYKIKKEREKEYRSKPLSQSQVVVNTSVDNMQQQGSIIEKVQEQRREFYRLSLAILMEVEIQHEDKMRASRLLYKMSHDYPEILVDFQKKIKNNSNQVFVAIGEIREALYPEQTTAVLESGTPANGTGSKSKPTEEISYFTCRISPKAEVFIAKLQDGDTKDREIASDILSKFSEIERKQPIITRSKPIASENKLFETSFHDTNEIRAIYAYHRNEIIILEVCYKDVEVRAYGLAAVTRDKIINGNIDYTQWPIFGNNESSDL